jgi:hypothetical protein
MAIQVGNWGVYMRKDKRSFSPDRAFVDALGTDEISRARVALKANFLCRTQAPLEIV